MSNIKIIGFSHTTNLLNHKYYFNIFNFFGLHICVVYSCLLSWLPKIKIKLLRFRSTWCNFLFSILCKMRVWEGSCLGFIFCFRYTKQNNKFEFQFPTPPQSRTILVRRTISWANNYLCGFSIYSLTFFSSPSWCSPISLIVCCCSHGAFEKLRNVCT